MNDRYAARKDIFKVWLLDNYKATVAKPVYNTFVAVDTFLAETAVNKQGLLMFNAEKACLLIDSLNHNRVFKFRYKAEASYLTKLISALRIFLNQENLFADDAPVATPLPAIEVIVFSEDEIPKASPVAEETENIDPVSKDTTGEMPDSIPVVTACESVITENAENNARVEELLEEPARVTPTQPAWLTKAQTFIASDTPEEFVPCFFDRENEPLEKILPKLMESIVIRLDGEEISLGHYQWDLVNFMSKAYHGQKQNQSIVLHTGSVIFEALALVYVAFYCILSNKRTAEDIVRNLEPGDVILSHGAMSTPRCRFEGFEHSQDIEYARFVQEDKGRMTTRLPKSLWYKIEPYHGLSERLDARGIRSHTLLRRSFYEKVLNTPKEEVPVFVDTSAVIVMQRNRADHLMNGITLTFGDEKIRLLELVTASYYSEENEHYYGGNIGKNEPVLKFTGKVSVARQKVMEHGENSNVGLVVFGDELITGATSELPALMKRKSLHFSSMFLHGNAELNAHLIDTYEDAKLFACTKKYLNGPKCMDRDNLYTREMYEQAYAIAHHSISTTLLEGPVSWPEKKRFMRLLQAIKTSACMAPEKEDFSMNAWALMHLCEHAVFSLETMEELCNCQILPVTGPYARLNIMKELLVYLTDDIRGLGEEIISMLQNAMNKLNSSNEKQAELECLLTEREDSKICVVVPREYYARILKDAACVTESRNVYNNSVTIVTANRFSGKELFDLVIAVGDFAGSHFEALSCDCALEIVSLLYSSEIHSYQKRIRKANELTRAIAKRASNTVSSETELIKELPLPEDADLDVYEEQNSEMVNYIDRLMASVMWNAIPASSSGASEADVVAVAMFDSGERAFFTPNYKAYRLNPDTSEVDTVKVEDLHAGDSLVFTKNDDATHDIVDEIIENLLAEKRLSEFASVCYTESKKWKVALQEYMSATGLKPTKIARAMKKNGTNVVEQTIVGWLDPFAHTVCPRDIESIRQIGVLTELNDLVEHPEVVMNAGKEIKKIRKQILKGIGQQIVDKMSGKPRPAEGTVEASIYDRLDSQADVLCITQIVPVERKMPMNYTNRPVSNQ